MLYLRVPLFALVTLYSLSFAIPLRCNNRQLPRLKLAHSCRANSKWFMGSVIIGATSLEQFEEVWAAFDVKLSKETMQAIDAIHMEDRNPQWSE